ncbi:hypothetical protein [Paraburkholderia sp. MM6662-R1]
MAVIDAAKSSSHIGSRFYTAWVVSVSSPMQEAAAGLLDAATVSNPAHC